MSTEVVKRVLFILDHLGEDLSFHAEYVIAHTLFAIIDYLLVCTSQQLEEASSTEQTTVIHIN